MQHTSEIHAFRQLYLHAVTEDLADNIPIANFHPGLELDAILNEERLNIAYVGGCWQVRHLAGGVGD